MNRILAGFLMMSYFALAVGSLIWWAPHFFIANVDIELEWTYRYWSASFIPFGLLMTVLAGRQSLAERLLLFPLWQGLASGLLLWCVVYTFDYTPQSQPFAMLHILVTGVFALWNLWAYRREVKKLERYRGALA